MSIKNPVLRLTRVNILREMALWVHRLRDSGSRWNSEANVQAQRAAKPYAGAKGWTAIGESSVLFPVIRCIRDDLAVAEAAVTTQPVQY